MRVNKLMSVAAVISAVVLVLPGLASAQSVADLQAQIQALLAQVQQLQAQLSQIQGGGAAQWCHTFNTNLGVGSSGSEVVVLITALNKEGLGGGKGDYYDEALASAVSGFQEKYASEILTPNGLSHGTGFVGKSTRAKLNALYGCSQSKPPAASLTASQPIFDQGSYDVTFNWTSPPSSNAIRYFTINCVSGVIMVDIKGGSDFRCGDVSRPVDAIGGYTVQFRNTNRAPANIIAQLDYGTGQPITTTVTISPAPIISICEYASPPPGCSYVHGPNFDPTTGCGSVLNCTPVVTQVISPGVIAPGYAAFVQGSGFDSNSIVVIDGTQVPTTFISTQSLQFIVPASASLGSHTSSVTEKAGPNSNTVTFTVVAAGTTQPSITVTYPQSGNILSNGPKGDIATITWTSSSIGPYVGIALYKSDGTTFVKYIATNAPNNGAYLWSQDLTIASGYYQISVYDSTAKAGASGVSGIFQIVTSSASAPSVTVYVDPKVNPAGWTLTMGSTGVNLLGFGITNNSSEAIKVQSISLVETTSNSTYPISNLHIYYGSTLMLVSCSAVDSTGLALCNFTTPLTISAGTGVSFSVYGDVASYQAYPSAAGATVSVTVPYTVKAGYGVTAVGATSNLPATQSGNAATAAPLFSIVAATTQPSITSFTATPSSLYPSHQNVYLVSWSVSGASAGQVNLTAGCASGLTISMVDDAGRLQTFQCGDIARTVAYGAGSEYLQFTNTSGQSINETISLSVVGANTKTVTVTIPAANPTVTSFTALPIAMSSGGAVTFSWVTQNADAVDFQVACRANLVITDSNYGSFACGDVSRSLPPNSSLILRLMNTTDPSLNSTITATAIVTPMLHGTGNGLSAKMLTISVSPTVPGLGQSGSLEQMANILNSMQATLENMLKSLSQ